jgi:spermidine/putrescine transport system substrate-binding protein
MPANRAAGDVLTDAEKAALRWDNQDDYLANSQLYPTPTAELDLSMQDLWTDMIQQ